MDFDYEREGVMTRNRFIIKRGSAVVPLPAPSRRKEFASWRPILIHVTDHLERIFGGRPGEAQKN